tara:strand:- start:896 stop:1219 length:324 start_codon:yes stop_codon:yes gene_type:complete
MAQLSTKIKHYAKANNITDIDFFTDVILEDKGKGPYIAEWNLNIKKPTTEQLLAYEKAANTEEANNAIRAKRKVEYGDIGEQLDEIYKDIDAWKIRIKSIKDKYPKG